MLKESNLPEIKKTAKAFLHMPIELTDVNPLLMVNHPVFETAVCGDRFNGEYLTVNLLSDKEGKERVIRRYEERIDTAENPYGVYSIICKAYRLTFIKYIKQHLSKSDFSDLLADAWVSSENPNQDANVKIPMLISWFKQADKKALMTDEEYEVYASLPSTVTVYRGVAVGRNPKGLSWTANHSTAEWFANRFNTDTKKGYIQKATVSKSKVVAYFNSRNEDELVVDTKGIDIQIEEQM